MNNIFLDNWWISRGALISHTNQLHHSSYFVHYLYINVEKWHFSYISPPPPLFLLYLALFLLLGGLYSCLCRKHLSSNSASGLITPGLGLVLDNAFIWPRHIKMNLHPNIHLSVLSVVPHFSVPKGIWPTPCNLYFNSNQQKFFLHIYKILLILSGAVISRWKAIWIKKYPVEVILPNDVLLVHNFVLLSNIKNRKFYSEGGLVKPMRWIGFKRFCSF